ncbi:hypothetical protein [Endozoicomonas sp.]|uniref:hypothetical protein n=1 Tax=Endozoicomonas sp. TaxID=1892382 RepID=UPI002884CCB0|nr:hypothetical protein [Endozoicomonas sp.]
MPVDAINSSQEDLVALQIKLTAEEGKASASRQAEEATEKYHDELAHEDILMGQESVVERSNAQRLASILAKKGRV